MLQKSYWRARLMDRDTYKVMQILVTESLCTLLLVIIKCYFREIRIVEISNAILKIS